MIQNASASYSILDPEFLDQDNLRSGPIVLVDNDNELTKNIHEFLRVNGFSVIVETSGRRGKAIINSVEPILVILDIVLPDMDGLSICRDIRTSYHGPILIITELNDDIDEVASLETGADGFLNKPVQPRVLLAHIRALLRRNITMPPELVNESDQNSTSQLIGKENLFVEPITICQTTRSVWMNDQRIDMTSGEFDLLWHLISHAGQILSRDKLYSDLRGMEYDGVDRAIDQHISNIRKKFGDDSKPPKIIKSVRGVGYLLAG